MRLATMCALCATASLPFVSAAWAEQSFTLTLKDHRFSPAALTVTAGEAFSLVVVNADASAEEFESQDLHIEKVVGGGKQITVHVDGLAKGTYGFVGERHEDTAIGNLFAE